MTGEEFIKVWGNLELRQYIIDQARRHSKNKEDQEDFVQEAWFYIGFCPYSCDADYYKQVGLNAITNLYRQYRAERFGGFRDLQQ